MGIKSSRIIGLVAEDGIALMAASSQIGNPGSILIGNQFSSLLLWNLSSEWTGGS